MLCLPVLMGIFKIDGNIYLYHLVYSWYLFKSSSSSCTGLYGKHVHDKTMFLEVQHEKKGSDSRLFAIS